MTLAIAGRTMFGADVRGDAAMVAEALELAMHAQVANLRSPLQLGYEWPLPRHRQMRRALQQGFAQGFEGGRANGPARQHYQALTHR